MYYVNLVDKDGNILIEINNASHSWITGILADFDKDDYEETLEKFALCYYETRDGLEFSSQSEEYLNTMRESLRKTIEEYQEDIKGHFDYMIRYSYDAEEEHWKKSEKVSIYVKDYSHIYDYVKGGQVTEQDYIDLIKFISINPKDIYDGSYIYNDGDTDNPKYEGYEATINKYHKKFKDVESLENTWKKLRYQERQIRMKEYYNELEEIKRKNYEKKWKEVIWEEVPFRVIKERLNDYIEKIEPYKKPCFSEPILVGAPEEEEF